MKKLLLFSLLILAPLLSLPLRAKNSPPCDLAVTAVNLIDIEDKTVYKNMDVQIAGDQISAIEKHDADSSAQCREQIDGAGKFLMPGLVDMHTHADAIFLPRADGYTTINRTIPLTLPQSGAMLLRAGVTAFLDLCSVPQDQIFAMRDQQRAGKLKIDMPDIYAAGSCITSKWFDHTGDPNQFNDEKQIADVTLLEKDDTYKKAYPTDKFGYTVHGYEVKEKASELSKVDRLLAKNPDVIKVFYTVSWDDGAEYPSLHLDTIKEIVKRAHAKHIPVLAHALQWSEQVPLLDTGIDGLAHAATDVVTGWDKFKDWKPKKPLYVIPTVTVFNSLTRLTKEAQNEIEDPLLAAILGTVSPKIETQVLNEFRDFKKGDIKNGMEKLRSNYRLDYESFLIPNVKRYKRDERFQVVAGSDSSNLGGFLGFALHQELSSMVDDIGYTEWAALASATIEPAKFLKVAYGSKVGSVANLILLAKSPVENIQNTRTVEQVILRGKALPKF